MKKARPGSPVSDNMTDEQKEREEIFKKLDKFKLKITKMTDKPGTNLHKGTSNNITVENTYGDGEAIASVKISNTTSIFMKTLENMMYREVPTLAFDIIKENINTGPLLYDILFKRIQNIPIIADNTQFDYFTDDQLILLAERPDLVSIPLSDEAITEYFDDNIVRFTLVAEGLSGIEIEEKDYYVKADKLKYHPTPSQRERGIKVRVDPNTVITKLYKGQKIDLELYAILGKGRDGTKHVPVQTVFWDYDKDSRKYRMITPMHTSYLRNKGDNQTITDFEYSTAEFVADYHMTVESRGQMSALEIIEEAADIVDVYMNIPLKDRTEDVSPLHYF